LPAATPRWISRRQRRKGGRLLLGIRLLPGTGNALLLFMPLPEIQALFAAS
jgi:hypothetical protein